MYTGCVHLPAARTAFATLLARYRELEHEYGRLYAFVEDVRDSKAQATTDEECVMAFVRLGNAAENLLAAISDHESEESAG